MGQVVKPDASAEEIDRILEDGSGNAIFTQELLADRSSQVTDIYIDISLMCLRPHMRTLEPNVNVAIFQLGRLLMENSRKYTSLSGSLS